MTPLVRLETHIFPNCQIFVCSFFVLLYLSCGPHSTPLIDRLINSSAARGQKQRNFKGVLKNKDWTRNHNWRVFYLSGNPKHGEYFQVCQIPSARGGGALNIFSGRGVRPGFPKWRACEVANWHLPLKRGACERKISKFGACELKISKFGDLWA